MYQSLMLNRMKLYRFNCHLCEGKRHILSISLLDVTFNVSHGGRGMIGWRHSKYLLPCYCTKCIAQYCWRRLLIARMQCVQLLHYPWPFTNKKHIITIATYYYNLNNIFSFWSTKIEEIYIMTYSVFFFNI